MNKKIIIAVSVLIVALLFVGTIFYYNGVVNDRNSKIANLNNEIAKRNSEIANLTSQISNLKSQVANLTYLTSANLTTALNVTDTQAETVNLFGVVNSYLPFNNMYISGSVTNEGEGTAYNAGLHVVAYDNGALEVNITVPLVDSGYYGTDATTNAFVAPIGDTPTQLGSLNSGQTASINLSIYHEGNATNWTITPVWTNSP